jgi:hypothetical protein
VNRSLASTSNGAVSAVDGASSCSDANTISISGSTSTAKEAAAGATIGALVRARSTFLFFPSLIAGGVGTTDLRFPNVDVGCFKTGLLSIELSNESKKSAMVGSFEFEGKSNEACETIDGYDQVV